MGTYGGVASGQRAAAGDLHGKDDAASGQVVFIFGDTVSFLLYFVKQVVVVAM